ncbi:ST3 beta-galactoside alpha-2,3-sialyltransferase 8 [Mugil cephalus]|uniref:ST3 beta-galactoside alpha-2,3-sialyltransferase 8 n=1 Tax=Mugil cephalus TaxID=48193 RepID=UPI001FB76DF1|nr:ST3 beta-galactoside alpha-2,3-sialyltransferase 8 [Mugil cephalus]
MLLRRKVWVATVIAAILFLMIATHSIQRRHSPLSSRSSGIDTGHTGRQTEVEPTTTPKRVRLLTPPSPIDTQEEEEEEDEEEEEEEGDEEEMEEDELKEDYQCGCSASCISNPDGSDWFRHRYDHSQQPVIRDTKNFDPDALEWWLGLQRSGSDRTLEEVIVEMFQVISPPTVDFRPLPSRCRSCAVVGNSGNLLQSGHGNLINSHDSVIRMNKAVTRGYEKDVGNRTTHHFLYPESAVDVGRGVSLVLLPFKLRDLEWLTSALSTGQVKMTYMRVRERVEADKDKVLVVNPVFFKYVHDRWTEHHGRYPSTGMLAIIFALHTCDQVSVFGYGADKQGNWHHYWEANRYAGAFRKTGVHSADYETQVILQLAKEGKISLHL